MTDLRTKPTLCLLCVIALAISLSSVTAWATQPQVMSNAVVNEPIQADVSAPLRTYPTAGPGPTSETVHEPLRPKLLQMMAAGVAAGQPLKSPIGTAGPGIGLNFQGISGDPGSPPSINCPVVSGVQLAPPDTNAAIGDTQIVQWVNICYSVFDKATGALIAGPFAGNHFWSGFGGSCQIRNDGDIIIQWDKANHVWVASQNTFAAPYTTCIAVSQTADATGVYNRFAFTQPGFPDYPKWGLTPDIYYQTQNDFGIGGSGYVGVNVCAYDGAAMRAGSKKAKQICVLDNSGGTLFDDSMLPADTDADPKPAPGAPEVLVGSIDNANPGLNVYYYLFSASFKGKGKATLTGTNGSLPIRVPQYALACGGFGACIPQPSPGSELIDSLGDRLMYRLAMFDDGTTQHFLVNHSVNDTSGAVGARWYEFVSPTSTASNPTLSLAQAGQTPADGEYRWMGSVARDKFGDIALGYSRSSAAAGDFPSIYVSGQTAGEPAGTTDPEVLVKQGSGSQINTANRWGDYSSMALNSADQCTFLYTTEYYPFDGSFQWYTWLSVVKFPSCP
jgi:hypothetical protein